MVKKTKKQNKNNNQPKKTHKKNKQTYIFENKCQMIT